MSATVQTTTVALTTTPVRADSDAVDYYVGAPFTILNNGPNIIRVGDSTVTATVGGQRVGVGETWSKTLQADSPQVWIVTTTATASVVTIQTAVFTAGGGAPSGAAGGDLSGTYPNPGVAKLNGTALSGLATGVLKNTTGTGVPSIAAAADIPTVAAGGTGPLAANDATTTNSRAPSGSAGGDISGTYPSTITVAKINGTALSGLATGIVKNTTGTGVPVIAVAADIPLAAIGATGPMPAATALSAITVPAAAVAFNAQKITGLANGSAATDGAAFGQIPVASAVLPATLAVGAVIGSGTAFAKSDHAHTRSWWVPSDYGYLAMTYPPELVAVSGAAMTAGTVYVSAVLLDSIQTIASLDLSVATAGATLTASQCGVALYDPSKTLIGFTFTNSASTQLATALTSTGKVSCTLGATGTGLTSLAVGKYYCAIFQNGTTPAVLRTSASSGIANGNLSAANSKYASADTGRTTTFPATLAAFTAFSSANFFAIY